MRVIIQTVNNAEVIIDNKEKNVIGKGLLCYVSFCVGDTIEKVDKAVYKISGLRVFADNEGKTNLSLKDINGEMLIISNFTIYSSLVKGFRPSFDNVMSFDESNKLYLDFVEKMKKEFPTKVQTGKFGASMLVSSQNSGPKNFIYEI